MVDDLARSLSLYFALRPGEKADLEVVADAAIHWVAALKAAAVAIDPEAKLRVEIVDAEEGSLRINTILDWAEDQLQRIEHGGIKHWRVKKLAIATAVFVVTVGIPTYDYYFGPSDEAELSDEDRERIDELIEIASEAPAVEDSRKKLFRTLERDRSIDAIGVSEERTKAPRILIPSSEFAGRSGLWGAPSDDSEQERTVWPRLDVTLISPVLLALPRAWQFKPEGLPEFSAKMKDDRFLKALATAHVRERLRFGIPMTIQLKVEEVKVGGVWTVKRGGRSVVEVISPKIE